MDISKLATKIDIKTLKGNIEKLRAETRSDIQKLDTKLDHLQNTLDGFVGVVDDLRTDNVVGTHQTRELQVKIDDHEKRLKQIESLNQVA